MKTIAVVNQKGGAGKTTIATNLAATSHLAGNRTLLLDLDPQQTATDWFYRRAEDSKLAGLNVIPVDVRLKPAHFAELTSGYDVVVIDTPPRLETGLDDPNAKCEQLTAAILADAIVVPVEPEYFNLWACDATFRLISSADAIREQMGKLPTERFVILNKARDSEKLTKLAKESLGEVAGYREDLPIRRAVLFKQSQGAGETVHIKPGCSSAKELGALFSAIQSSFQAYTTAQGAALHSEGLQK